jgi:hypothetical protein
MLTYFLQQDKLITGNDEFHSERINMLWFKKKRRPQELHVPKISFICEQDGVPERDLKQKFIPLFEVRDHILSAYLARVSYAKPDELNVALCIRMNKKDGIDLRKAIGEIFAAIFNRKEHLDIIFIQSNQEEELRKVCQPFFEKN